MKMIWMAGFTAVALIAAPALYAAVVEGDILEVRQEVSQVILQDGRTGFNKTVNVTDSTQFLGTQGLGYLFIGQRIRVEGMEDTLLRGLNADTIEVIQGQGTEDIAGTGPSF